MIKKVNFKLIIPVIVFAMISIISIYCASIYTSSSMGNLTLKQSIWYIVGIILVFIIFKLKNEFLYRHTWFLYILGNILLLGLLFFGTPINNSKCWYTIPGIGSFQPSEFMKIFLMLALATLIHNFRTSKKNPDLKDEFVFILKSLIVVGIPSILTFLQPDTGAVIIYLVIYIFMMFVSGIRIRWFISGVALLISGVRIVLSIYFFQEELFIDLFGTSIFYRLDRIFDWQNGSGLQLENALASIGSAGLFGHGFNKAPIYFPEASTDFIFAIYASCFGFVGALVLIGVIIYFDVNIIKLAKKKIHDTDKYIIAGIVGMLIFQQVQNISMTVGLLPITGITLPFISYGGSSLLSYMFLIGILLNIANDSEKTYKYK